MGFSLPRRARQPQVNVGTAEQYQQVAAMKAVGEFRAKINRETRSPLTIAELVSHYREKELTEDSRKSFSARTAYAIYLRNWIVPVWGQHFLSDVRTIAVEDWLHGLTLSNGNKAKIRNLMSALFDHAIRYEWVEKNLIRLVRQSAKREKAPNVLTAEEIKALLAELGRALLRHGFSRRCHWFTGQRTNCSQLVDVAAGEMHLTRAIVCQHIGSLKTEASQKPVPMDARLSALLLDWRKRCPYNQDSDYVFGSPEMHATRPLWPSSAMSKHIRPAAKRAGIKKQVCWHVFRHLFATLLKRNGEDVKTVQESLRHAASKVTLDTYTQGLMPVKKAAQQRVFEAVVPKCSNAAVVATARA
jgi:integrase